MTKIRDVVVTGPGGVGVAETTGAPNALLVAAGRVVAVARLAVVARLDALAAFRAAAWAPDPRAIAQSLQTGAGTGLPFQSVVAALTTWTLATGPVSDRLAVFVAFCRTLNKTEPLPSGVPVPFDVE